MALHHLSQLAKVGGPSSSFCSICLLAKHQRSAVGLSREVVVNDLPLTK